MLKEAIEKNADIKANTKELSVLKKHFPACFDKDGKFDIKVFEDLIKKEDVDIKKEGYSLNFLGKSYARYLSSLDSETVIVPDEDNKDIQSENIYIVGDNLDALQHLKYSYSERIKCIYIDPPYNTGSDGFVYNDKFEFTAEELAKKINIEDDEAERILNMQGKSTHSAWLTFMYPRLELSRELLSDDGVIFISIDDNENHNLKLLCDSIFGEGNFIGESIRKTKTMTGDDGSGFNTQHENLLIYSKNKEKVYFKGEEKDFKNYTNLDNDPNGDWCAGDPSAKSGGETTYFPIKNPNTNKIDYPPQGRYWAFSKSTFLEYVRNGKIKFKTEHNTNERGFIFKRYKKDASSTYNPFNSLLIESEDMNQNATVELRELMGSDLFNYPKPVSYLKKIIKSVANEEEIILDFFSGSATTAHAVMQLNAEDGGNRKYIMVQLDESAKEGSEAHKAGFKTVDEVGRERIRRAAAKIKEEEPEKSKNVDLGFKTYYLKEADKNTLDKIRDFNPDMPFDAGDIKDKFGIDTIIETWKIRDGFGFNAKVEKIDLEGYTAYKVSNSEIGEYLYLLDEMEDGEIKELVRKIEAFELNIDKIIEYGYSFSYNANTALRANLKTLKNKNAIDVIIRY